MATAVPEGHQFPAIASQSWGGTAPPMARAIPPHHPPPPPPPTPPSVPPPRLPATPTHDENENIINNGTGVPYPSKTHWRLRNDHRRLNADLVALSTQRPRTAPPSENPELKPSDSSGRSPKQQQHLSIKNNPERTSHLHTADHNPSFEEGVHGGMCAKCRAEGVPPGFCMHNNVPTTSDYTETRQQQQRQTSRGGGNPPTLRLRAFLEAQRAELEKFLGDPELV
ncbi:hypothetical protein FOZ62_010803, partial [Perkinsus olseni]